LGGSPSTTARLIELLARRTQSARVLHDLAPAQWAVLRMLAGRPRGYSVVEITTFLGVAPVAGLRLAAALHRKGLIEIVGSSPDEGGQACLTELGKARIQLDPVIRIEAALACLTPEEQGTLGELIERLLERFRPE
jgi:DNA-binding MarR family transcriptional regulator